ncbi:hypothetical protein [Micromonospora inaquosa]|uniref:hypothetical protein n=1 Tax=Micromonospora inaquosa TaxID=2203716 RepID=UPI003CC5B891
MSQETPARDRPLTTALTQAAATAGLAPSVHNSQPWRWTVLPDALELRMVQEPQLAATDPENRLVTLSCGLALHHARVALAAEGWAAQVERLPDPDQLELLARLSRFRQTAADADATRLVQCMRVRQTDRRPVSDEPVPNATLDEIVKATCAQGARLQLLGSDQVMELAAVAAQAAVVAAEEPGAAGGARVLDQPGRGRHRAAARGVARAGPADHRAGPGLRPYRHSADWPRARPRGRLRDPLGHRG